MDIKELGITRHQRWLLWSESGAFRWMPYLCRAGLVSLWNDLSCAIFGHGLTLSNREEPDLPEGEIICVYCCKHWKNYG
jgi:hypothetical protein